jgi:hypothetical protein
MQIPISKAKLLKIPKRIYPLKKRHIHNLITQYILCPLKSVNYGEYTCRSTNAERKTFILPVNTSMDMENKTVKKKINRNQSWQ